PYSFALRLGWPFEDPNSLALVLVSIVPFAYALTRSEQSTPLKIIALSCGLTVIAATFPTLSRGGILALIIVLMYILFKERKEKVVLYMVFAVTLVGLYLLYSKFNIAIELLTERFARLDRSVVQRYRLYKGGIAMFLDHPIFGVGIGNFLVYSISYTKLLGQLYAHNMFIHVAAELGIVAFALFTGIILTAFRKLRRIEQAAIQKANKPLLFQSRGIQISLVGLTICGMFLSQHFNKILWILFGLSVSMTQVSEREGVAANKDA
nr:O-antigen ligase family protein [candidate division KSB1 bacterium]NIR71521.1 O-antigen ligase family protein [candidate division KSB1 bacterium]NIS26327.1 O-antigen ligase family protein [candidate division KSB1 bacterium]NIT73094.1 O-antigen ligase family protein [candidate division KSB1 bacterium]NIU27009.1 O-antigen ligase family protein [candidate division KSB1 bacterium]